MTGGVVPTWPGPPDHPVVLVGRGDTAGAACGCGDWQAYLPDADAALRARASYAEHLRRACLPSAGDTPDTPDLR